MLVGRGGLAITLVTQYDIQRLKSIETEISKYTVVMVVCWSAMVHSTMVHGMGSVGQWGQGHTTSCVVCDLIRIPCFCYHSNNNLFLLFAMIYMY